jgi:hypothetical protein
MRYRPIPNTKEIQLHLHCRRCMVDLPDGESPESWGRYSVGWTTLGIQVWCTRCNRNVVHIDFEGIQLRADSSARPFEIPETQPKPKTRSKR